MIMVNLEVYTAYSDQHKEKLMRSASLSRKLNRMKMNQHRKNKRTAGMMYWVLKRFTRSSSSLSEDTGSILDTRSSLLSE
jgi:hypothetical protein